MRFSNLGFIANRFLLAFTSILFLSSYANASENIQNVSAQEAAVLLNEDKNIVVLDIRTPKEFNEGHIEGAINIDFYANSFEKDIAKLDRNTGYILHCRSGGRSGKSEKLLIELGFTKIYHMNDGFKGWRAANLPQVSE